jgi:glycosyltransferase involved in cell wall biosynthesis
MDYPKISLITPSYNQAQYLEETIQSVIQQNYPNLEYIIIDGGSDDGSLEIIQKYSQFISYWCSTPDDGQADAIRKGFRMASGEIFSWINSDDVLCRSSLASVAEVFTSDPSLGMIFGNAFLIDEKSKPKGIIVPFSDFSYYKYGASGIFQGSVFYTKSAYFSAGEINPKWTYAMEYELFFEIEKRCKVKNIPKFLSCYRLHPLSKSSNLQKIAREECEEIFSSVLGIDINSFDYKLSKIKMLFMKSINPFFLKDIFLKKCTYSKLYHSSVL